MIYINDFAIHLAKAEEHRYESEVTEYPVEVGADMADHIRPRPTTVTIDAIHTETPITGITPSTDLTFDALTMLETLHATREPVTIDTTLRRFKSMVLTSLSIPRDKDTGKALRFSATFQQVLLVENERAVIRVRTPSSAKKVTVGEKAAEVAPPPPPAVIDPDKRSAARKAYDQKKNKETRAALSDWTRDWGPNTDFDNISTPRGSRI